MKLFSAPGSCSTASEIALAEAGVDIEVINVDLMGNRKLPDGRDLSDINPKGYVPVLELDDGTLLTENVAILPYIAEQYPDAGLIPESGSMQYTRFREWLGYINSEVHKAFGHFFNPHLPADMREILISTLDRRYAFIDAHLANNHYLLGDAYSVADIYLFIVSSWAPMVGYDLSGNDNVQTWNKRVGERPAVQKVMASIPH